ncbi:MAG: aminotransferase class I/II-fold pyridoxal phosphate-dependent enzyme [Oscillospiraceae bacterium]|nr:aminotransferase class I/II-fold pyridoxal phosphate-dependent enzyme [Oscillospiraceae bacterium]
MDTPILDFLKEYESFGTVRMHMPGHKGRSLLGCESLDITEISGADALYEAGGIIAKSEENAAAIFGTSKTLYSTEGSSQCIKAMVHLAVTCKRSSRRPYLLAGRNAHKAFIYALALSDADVKWLSAEGTDSLCSCVITARHVEKALSEADTAPAAVYITSPDYLGGQLPVREIAQICRSHGVPLLVDNAHGAYLHFLTGKQHPMDLGADMCCDSAHKTLPVLTGGAYLHISKQADAYFGQNAKAAMAIYGSTSPSYLTLASLDNCNLFLCDGFKDKLEDTVCKVAAARKSLIRKGWETVGTEPLKITVRCPEGLSGNELAGRLRSGGLECEYADEDYVVFMPSVLTEQRELQLLDSLMEKNNLSKKEVSAPAPLACKRLMTVRQALFSPQEYLPVSLASGRICAAPTAGCPPAVPIVVSGELIDENASALLEKYGIERIAVVTQSKTAGL